MDPGPLYDRQEKIAVTGFSMGGAGAWHFAEKFPERFSAAIPVEGRPPASAAGWRFPVLAIHSRDDPVVPFGRAEARIAELKGAGVNAKLIPLTGITHYETYRYGDALRQFRGCVRSGNSVVPAVSAQKSEALNGHWHMI